MGLQCEPVCRLRQQCVTEQLQIETDKASLLSTTNIISISFDIDFNTFFTVIGNNSGTRGHAYKLHINYCRVNT